MSHITSHDTSAEAGLFTTALRLLQAGSSLSPRLEQYLVRTIQDAFALAEDPKRVAATTPAEAIRLALELSSRGGELGESLRRLPDTRASADASAVLTSLEGSLAFSSQPAHP